MQKEAEKNFEITRTARASLDEVTVLQEVLREYPQDTKSRIMIGKIVLEHESERTGLFWLQSVFSYDPTNSEAHEAIASYFESKKKGCPKMRNVLRITVPLLEKIGSASCKKAESESSSS